ncbi:MAG: hypothetical protein RI897_1141 [Verrucomicrobiota bacterium]|jgi:predicted dehydrogenase
MHEMTRRRFLSRSAQGAVIVPFGLALAKGQASAASANEKVRVALIGCGGMGKGDLDTFFQNPEVECPVVCDVDDGQIAGAVELVERRRGGKPDTVKDFRRVLDRKDVDAVIVATPDHWHALPTVMACQAGKDVYVEKPLAKSIAEGRAMVTAGTKHRRVVQMGTQRRSSEHIAQAVDFVRSGKLGQIGMVRSWAYLDWVGGVGNPPDTESPAGVDYNMWLGPAELRPFNPNRFHFNFRWFWDYAGGLMTDWGVHLIDVLLMGMGQEPPKAVMSSGGKYVLKDNTDTPDTQITVYEFPSYTLVWEHKVGVGLGPYGKDWSILFTGTEGTLMVNDTGWEILREKKSDAFRSEKFPGSGDPRPAHVRNFLDCMNSRKQPNQNLVSGHHVSTVAHLGNIALRTGRKLHWDHENEQVKDDPEANALVKAQYRSPWKLPYMT